MLKTPRRRRLVDAYAFPGFRAGAAMRGRFGDPQTRIVSLSRRAKKRAVGPAGRCITASTTARADVHPVGGLVERAAVALRIDKGLQQHDRVTKAGSPTRSTATSTSPVLHILERDMAAGRPVRRRAPASDMPAALPGAHSKRIFDVLGALLLGIVLSPFILAIVLMIRLEGRPVLFWHKRIGRNGKAFLCLKFRTMAPDAEQTLRKLLRANPALRDEWTENHKLRDDPRITLTGRFLRQTSLDELPQLWNILRGEMSLVGPRPIVRAELLRYGREAATYLAVKPGLTGLWQVKGRSDTSYRRRVAMDKYYVRNRTVLLDLYVVLATVGVVLKRAGAY
jgi:lipopolysaccharide/colanic/teichoic acid biosynthesis glycosyltransferase